MSIVSFTADEMLSATELSKKTSSLLTELADHEHDKFVIVRNNRPNAVLLSMSAYEALLEQVEDVQLTSLAKERLASFDRESAISHEEMKRKYG